MPGIFLDSQAALHLSATQLKSRNFAKNKECQSSELLTSELLPKKENVAF